MDLPNYIVHFVDEQQQPLMASFNKPLLDNLQAKRRGETRISSLTRKVLSRKKA
jgi:hypothetical protein